MLRKHNWIDFSRFFNRMEDELFFELLKNDKKRGRIILTFTGSILLLAVGFEIFKPEAFEIITRDKISPWLVIGIIASALCYSIVIDFIISHAIKRRKRPPELARYMNSLMEISFPAMAIYILTGALSPEVAMNIPPVFLFFIFIILSGYRLDMKVSIFTGVVAGLEYLALYYIFIDIPQNNTAQNVVSRVNQDLYHFPFMYYAKSFLFVLAGVLMGLVSRETKKQMLLSFETSREKEQIMEVLGQHVSPSVAEKLVEEKSAFSGENREISVMFLDIRNFTTFSEKRKPEEVIDYLNALFEFMIDIINKHGGIINKFLGDGFMAVFGAPLELENHAQKAINASIEIVNEVNKRSSEKEIIPTKIGIGIHSGNAMTGNVGSEFRKEYTIIGDVVNLASRIEQLNKEHSSQIIVSQAVMEFLPELEKSSTALGEVKVKGRETPVPVFKIL